MIHTENNFYSSIFNAFMHIRGKVLKKMLTIVRMFPIINSNIIEYHQDGRLPYEGFFQ